MFTPWWGQSPASRGQHWPGRWQATRPGWRCLTCLWRGSGHLIPNLSCITWVWSWSEWELWTGGSHLLTWVPWSGSPAHSPGAQSSGGQGPPRWGLAPAAWGQRRSGRRGVARGQLGRQRHGAARACGDQDSWKESPLITYFALDTATSLVCTSVSVRGWADTRPTATISPDNDLTWHYFAVAIFRVFRPGVYENMLLLRDIRTIPDIWDVTKYIISTPTDWRCATKPDCYQL